jgi:hypothetical protein
MYISRQELAAFDVLSSAAKCRSILTLVRALVEVDKEILGELGPAYLGGNIPDLYESHVRYKFQDAVDDWQDIVRCLRTGAASCNSLSAWRCAELQLAGENATPYIQSQTVRKPNGEVLDIFHVIVQRGEGVGQEWEDPSRTLGMPASDPSMSGARVIPSAGSVLVGDAGAIFVPGVPDGVGAPSWGD